MATDTFLQNTGGPQALNVYSANWQQVQGTFTIPNGAGDVRCTASGVDHLARYTALTPSASQYAEVIPAAGWAASGRYIGPAVRVSASGDAYSVQATGGDWVIGRMIAGAWTNIGSGTWTAVDAQPIRLEVETIDAATVRLVLKRAGTTVTTINDTNAARITAANSVGFGGYDAAGSDPGIAEWSGDSTSAGASEVSGNATIDEPSAGGGMESAAELSGNATVDEPGAGGGMSSAGSSEISGNATIDEPGAGGGMASAAEISGNATVDEPSAGGGMSGSGGTLTSGDLKDNGTGVHSNAPFEARVYAAGDGSLVVRKTALTSTTSATAPTCSFLDAAVVTGQQYYVQWIRTDTGQYGIELLTAT